MANVLINPSNCRRRLHRELCYFCWHLNSCIVEPKERLWKADLCKHMSPQTLRFRLFHGPVSVLGQRRCEEVQAESIFPTREIASQALKTGIKWELFLEKQPIERVEQ